MDQQQNTAEMIEFNKAVEQLWAMYDSCQKRFYVNESKENVNKRCNKIKGWR